MQQKRTISSDNIVAGNYSKNESDLRYSFAWPGEVLGQPYVILNDRALKPYTPRVYHSLDSRRWTQESTHYFKLHTFSEVLLNLSVLKSHKSFEILMSKARTALFKIIKENFFIPIINTFHIIDYQCRRQDDIQQDAVTIRILGNARPCEREAEKCNRCQQRYRCVTQRTDETLKEGAINDRHI